LNDIDGNLIIDHAGAKNVQLIFDLYLQGKSVLGIISELERLGIKSPTEKERWSKRSIDVILSNEKYIGNVRLLDNGKYNTCYLAEGNNPAIITKEIFQVVQIEKSRRSNVVQGKNGNQRKDTKYSSKSKKYKIT